MIAIGSVHTEVPRREMMSSFRLLSLAILGCSVVLAAQPAIGQEPTIADVGRDYYVRYCSVCHGQQGKGDGEFANLLKTPPPDLTMIAKRNDGNFPDFKVAEAIDGRRAIAAHGTGDMPIWGLRFGETIAGAPATKSVIRGQVALFVAYLRSIQQQ